MTASSAARPAGALRRLTRDPGALIALAVLIVLAGACLLAPWVSPYDPTVQDLAALRQLPSAAHLLGTDDLGRDVLSRLLYGGAQSLGGAALATVIAMVVGIPLGMLAGYLRGATDVIVSRFGDVMQAMPLIIVLMAVIGVLGNAQLPAMIVLGIALSVGFMRLARATTLAVRRELYVDAARASGLAGARILARHIFPNVRGPLLVQASLTMGGALLIQAGLGFLGLGPPPPAPTWGGMIANASENIYTAPWLLVPAGALLIVCVLALNYLGDALAGDQPAAVARTRRMRRRRAPLVQPVATGDAVPTAADSAVRVRDLTVRFGPADDRFAVVQRVSFDIARGECLGIVGESGCGKSVTARALLGLVAGTGRIEEGSIHIGDVDVVGLGARQLSRIRGTRIALVSQEPMVALDPSFTIGSQLREAIRRHTDRSRAQAHDRALELLALVGIPDPAATAASYSFQISGGMAQRAAIALALTGEPDVLVADEPTTALDVTVQAEILDVLRRLRAELGMAVLIVTHDLGVVADSCDRALVMYAGQVVETADVQTLLERPAHPYTAGLLDSMPSRAVRGIEMRAIPGIVPSPREWPVGCRFAPRCPFARDDCRTAPVSLAPRDEDRLSRCLHADELLTPSEEAA